MAKSINGIRSIEWAKHLRPYGKRAFWKRHRQVDLMQELVEETERLGLYPWSTTHPKAKKRYGIRYMGNWHRWYATAKDRDKAFEYLSKSQWSSLRPKDKCER